jgi:hypothetical protein
MLDLHLPDAGHLFPNVNLIVHFLSMAPTFHNSVPFIANNGEMGEHIRSKDWSSSPVGPPNDWHPSLKTALSIILNADYPMFIWWGKEDLTMFNNDAYIPVLGKKHPQSLGSSARKEWAEIWDDIGEVVKEVFEGKPFYAQDMRLLLGRKVFWRKRIGPFHTVLFLLKMAK